MNCTAASWARKILAGPGRRRAVREVLNTTATPDALTLRQVLSEPNIDQALIYA